MTSSSLRRSRAISLGLAALCLAMLSSPSSAQSLDEVCQIRRGDTWFAIAGQVTQGGDRIQAELCRGTRRPVGALLYTYDARGIGGRTVGVLNGVYRIVEDDWPDVVAVRVSTDAFASLHGARLGNVLTVGSDESSGVQVTSRPDSASVTWQGNLLGYTPLDTELAPGVYTLRIAKRGHEPQEFEVNLTRPILYSTEVVLAQVASAYTVFNSGRVAYFRDGDYAHAAEQWSLASIRKGDGSLLEKQLRDLPVYLEAASLMRDLAQRLPSGVNAADVASLLHGVIRDDDAGNRDGAQVQLDKLLVLVPNDPALDALHAKLRRTQ